MAEPGTIVRNQSGQIDIEATLIKQDKAIKWCVARIQKANLSVPVATAKVDPQKPITAEEVAESFDGKVEAERKPSKMFLFVYKSPKDGALTTAYVNMDAPVCAVCKAELPPMKLIGGNEQAGTAEIPSYECSCGVNYNYSIKNTKWWKG